MGRKSSNTVTVGKKMCKLEWQARFIVGKLRRGSSLTTSDLLNCLGKIGKSMQRMGLQKITDIKQHHIEKYFSMLSAKGLSAGRMANHATAMRMLCRMMGKSDIVPSNRVLGCSRDMTNRTKHADVRLDVAKASEVRSRLSDNGRIIYDMARCFGLRQKEAMMSNRSVSRDGVDCLIVEGTKGGRQRVIPITTDEQRAVLARNSAYRDIHGGKLIDENLSLKQGIRRLQNMLAAAGATRSSCANMHTVRREWIIERCLEILAAPKEQREFLEKELVEQCGHGRTEILRAYSSLLDESPED